MDLSAPLPNTEFSPYVCEKLGWYVYALRNPIDGRVFYVGKGTGNRVFAHANEAKSVGASQELSVKLAVIKSIHEAGRQVEHFLIRHGLATEKLAYDVEASVIDTLKLVNKNVSNDLPELTNKAAGHHSTTLGLTSTDYVQSLYDPPAAPELSEPILLIKVARLWTPTMSAEELYESTRQWWKLGDRREKALYALSVSRGVIREVYRIDPDSWESAQIEGKTRWRFSGAVDEALREKYRHTSVRHLHKRGRAGSVYYYNC